MTGLQRADAGARRQAVMFVVVGALAGLLLMVAVERYRLPLQDWLLSDPAQFARRIVLLAHLAAALLTAPLLGFAFYLWSFGVQVMRMQRYPPPGCRVIRDTPILQGPAAQTHGHRLKMLAVGLGIAGVAFWAMCWRLATALGEQAI